MEKDGLNIGIVTSPLGKAGEVPLSNLIRILCSLSNDIYVVTGKNFSRVDMSNEKLHIIGVEHKEGTNAFTKIINHIYEQIEISRKLAGDARNVDFYVFFIGGESALLPMLTAKLLGKKVALTLVGNPLKVAEVTKDTLDKTLKPLRKIKFMLNLMLSNKIIVYSHNIIKERRLEKYRSKLSIAHEHFLDLNLFNIRKKIEERKNLVGYIGRLSEEKGILNLVGAIPFVLKKRVKTRFLICGEGSLASKIREIVKINGLEQNVQFSGWVPHSAVPRYLNELKLFVLPSFTEGLPNILLEAMACGTPVLATPVGTMSEVIRDRETGFLLESNDPKHIADRIIELLSKPELLEKVSINAHRYVRENFSFQKTLESWSKIFSEIYQS